MTTNTNPQGSVKPEGQPKEMTTHERFKALLEPQKEPTDTQETEEQETSQEEIVDQEQQEDEQLSDESQDQVEDQEQDEGEEQQQDETPEVDLNAKVKVKINGEEKEITVQEAALGYQRLEDYTRGKQEIARQRTQLNEHLEAYKSGIEIVAKYVFAEAEAYKNLDWDKLKQSDPQKWSATKIEAQEAYNRAAELTQEWQQASAKQQELLTQQIAESLPEQHKKLSEKVDGWSDPEKQKDIRAKWSEYGQKLGFTLDELKSVYDHRYLVVLDKAMKYDELMDKSKNVTKQKVTNNPKVVRRQPGANANQPPAAQKKMSEAMNRLAKTGSRESAQEVFKLRLQNQLKKGK